MVAKVKTQKAPLLTARVTLVAQNNLKAATQIYLEKKKVNLKIQIKKIKKMRISKR